ncbi:hypothetical protein AB4089_06250 [Arthrobacter sp. 2MCAF15]|uniref:hypothetical protein n=1 Tax=Arthrobacter sp. 2MCAF15 TaxID=3232984 RepID=UPI003F92B482
MVVNGGELDIVVANAGVQLVGQDAKVGELSLEVWDKTVATPAPRPAFTGWHASSRRTTPKKASG